MSWTERVQDVGTQADYTIPQANVVSASGSTGSSRKTPAHPAPEAFPEPGTRVHSWSSPVIFGRCEGLQDIPQVTLTCHGFKSQQEADQAGEADPATVVTVPEGHEIQQLIANGGSCKEVWATG